MAWGQTSSSKIFSSSKIEKRVKIFPNPAEAGGFLNLQFDVSNQQTISIKLFDAVGKLVHTEALDFISGQSTHRLKLPSVQGLYNLYIETEEGKYKTTQISVK